uniref:Uncharacterized protein n=1 Tax=Arundo donax TaxID=35708 RepID=A0A0A9G478_ARUDO
MGAYNALLNSSVYASNSSANCFFAESSGISDGPSKLLSMYLTKSKLSPLTWLLCSSAGTLFSG